MPYLLSDGRIQFHPNARQRAAAHDHLAHAAHLRKLLRHDRGGVVVHLALGQHVGGQGEDENRRIGRVHFPVGRVVGKIGGQVAAGGVDGGLDVARRGVNVAVQIELQGDAGRSRGCSKRSFR